MIWYLVLHTQKRYENTIRLMMLIVMNNGRYFLENFQHVKASPGFQNMFFVLFLKPFRIPSQVLSSWFLICRGLFWRYWKFRELTVGNISEIPLLLMQAYTLCYKNSLCLQADNFCRYCGHSSSKERLRHNFCWSTLLHI